VTSLLVSAVDGFLGEHGLLIAPASSTKGGYAERDPGSPSPSPTKRQRTLKGRVDAIRAAADVPFQVDPAFEGPVSPTESDQKCLSECLPS
jgi:hypothetical protein